MTTIITGNGIHLAQMKAQLGALSLEIKGLTRRGRSMYSIIKQVYGLKGSRLKVYEQFELLIQEMEKEYGYERD